MIKHCMKLKFSPKNAACFILLLMGMNGVFAYAGEALDATNNASVATKWGDMTVKIMKATPGNTPTYGSRAVGYMGVTMYESVVWGSPRHKSLAGQVASMVALPKPNNLQKYNWVLALNAGQSYMLKQVYAQTSVVNKSSIDSLENSIYQTEIKTTNQEIAERSVIFGRDIAKAIFEWSMTDGGHEGYKQNFDSTYVLPRGAYSWKAPTRGQSPSAFPLHPHWGKNRTFSPPNQSLPVPEMMAFEYKVATPYYNQMMEVYYKGKTLTQEEKEIANWWGDDPSETFSPPGHSYNLATITIKTAKPDLYKAAETYARVGMAVADAFINCWKCKYTYHAQRPWGFIYYNVDTLWGTFWPEPPFPAFYSGHACQAAAATTALSDLYGNNFKFIDDSHVGRPKDMERLVEYKARSFNSFWEAALESANSRLYGGIHNCQDNEVGLTEGQKIGKNINALAWRK